MTRPSWDDTWMAVADVVAQRSLCSLAQIGAVIVDRDNKVCSTGYNGAPAGYIPIQFWEKAGNVTGTEPCSAWCERAAEIEKGGERLPQYETCAAVHSESNALLRSDRSAHVGGTMYVTSVPCFGCARLIANSGLSRVVFRINKGEEHRDPKMISTFLSASGLLVHW